MNAFRHETSSYLETPYERDARSRVCSQIQQVIDTLGLAKVVGSTFPQYESEDSRITRVLMPGRAQEVACYFIRIPYLQMQFNWLNEEIILADLGAYAQKGEISLLLPHLFFPRGVSQEGLTKLLQTLKEKPEGLVLKDILEAQQGVASDSVPR